MTHDELREAVRRKEMVLTPLDFDIAAVHLWRWLRGLFKRHAEQPPPYRVTFESSEPPLDLSGAINLVNRWMKYLPTYADTKRLALQVTPEEYQRIAEQLKDHALQRDAEPWPPVTDMHIMGVKLVTTLADPW